MTEHQESPTPEILLSRFAQILANNESFVANILARYQEQEGVTESDIMSQLGLSSDMYVRLAMCKRPSADISDSTEQIRQIASYVNCDVNQLARIIRQIDALASIGDMTKEHADKSNLRTYSARPGLLAAARDRTGAGDEAPSPTDSRDDSDAQDSE